jgi:hypothetical protein
MMIAGSFEGGCYTAGDTAMNGNQQSRSRNRGSYYKDGWHVSTFFRLVPISHILELEDIFCVERKTFSDVSLFKMVHIKFSVIFILAAATVAPVIALPVPTPVSFKKLLSVFIWHD